MSVINFHLVVVLKKFKYFVIIVIYFVFISIWNDLLIYYFLQFQLNVQNKITYF